jgi:hypothetical protein
MTKPLITFRSDTDPIPLTYQQLDDNFRNLRDATLTFNAGTGGTAVTIDLNGQVTLVAGTNVSITGNNTNKTITINATGGGGLSNPLTEDLNTASFKIRNDYVGQLVLDGNDGIRVLDEGVTSEWVQVNPFDGITNRRTINTDFSLKLVHNATERARITLQAETASLRNSISFHLDKAHLGRIVFTNGVTLHQGITTTQRDAIGGTAVDGMIIYNSTLGKFQGRAAGAWVDLH